MEFTFDIDRKLAEHFARTGEKITREHLASILFEGKVKLPTALSHLSRWSNGHGTDQLKAKHLIRAARFFECSIDELLIIHS